MRRRTAARVRNGLLLAIALIALSLALALPSRGAGRAGSPPFGGAGDQGVRAADALKLLSDALPASGYVWMPQLSPRGPLLIVVSLPDQRAAVYRNGVRIGLSKVSTGKPGFETPTGVFTILQKEREHYSNVYDNAPMPFMQRLTWGGVAMHAGQVPDAPASHGCVRLPYAFSEALFAATERGMTVIVSDVASGQAGVSTALLAPLPADAVPPSPSSPVEVSGDTLPGLGGASTREPAAGHDALTTADTWAPERSPEGPLVVVASISDGEVRVMRNAVEIGRAALTASSAALIGTRAYVMLDGVGTGQGIVPGRPPRRWLEVPLVAGSRERPVDLHALVATGALDVSPAFAQAVYDVLAPGSSVVVTDQPLAPLIRPSLPILTADEPPPARTTPALPASTPLDGR